MSVFDLPMSKKFCFYFINPRESSGLGEFYFFGSVNDFQDQLSEVFQVANPEGDYIEFRSKLKKFGASISENEISLRLVEKTEEILNVYKAVKYLGRTIHLSTSRDDFCLNIRKVYWSDQFDDDRSDDIPDVELKEFFEWIYTYPWG